MLWKVKVRQDYSKRHLCHVQVIVGGDMQGPSNCPQGLLTGSAVKWR